METEKDKHLLFVDVWSPMLDEEGEPKKDIFLGDKLYMNAKGYEIWRETLAPKIKSGLKGSFRQFSSKQKIIRVVTFENLPNASALPK